MKSVAEPDDNDCRDPRFDSEPAAKEFLRQLVWPNGPICAHCGVAGRAKELTKTAEGKRRGVVVRFTTHARSGTYQCNACRKQFTLTVNTILADSRVPVHKWLLAIHLMCARRNGLSARELQRELWGVNPRTGGINGSYRTAWFMARRIRWSFTQPPVRGCFERNRARPRAQGGKEPRGELRPGVGSRRTHIPMEEREAIRLLMKVKPTPGMPRPGRRPKSILEEINEELARSPVRS